MKKIGRKNMKKGKIKYEIPECYARTVTFCDFLSNFRKNTAKNTTKTNFRRKFPLTITHF